MQINSMMRLGLMQAGGAAAPPPTIAAPFASVNGPLDGPSAGPYESWSVEYGSQPTISANVAFTVSRQGYTAAAATTTYLDTMHVVKTTSAGGAVRQPYPNQALQSATTAALSDYIYSTDTPSGSVTNNSTFISPKPVANWATPARRLVGDSIGGDTVPVEVVAFHRNARGGKQVACVVFTITDGSTTVTATVATPEVSTYPGDLHPVIVYKLPATDISSLGTGTLTVNAKVYPWIGAAASVLDSSANSVLREFSPRYFYKNATKFTTPDIMYVDSALGNDTTAQVNSTGSPAATIAGAINRMRTGSSGAPWNTATTRIVIKLDGTYVMGSGSGASNGYAGGLLITRDTGSTTKAGVIIQYGAGAIPNIETSLPAPVTTGAIIFKDVSMLGSGGALNMVRGNVARLEVQLDQVACDNNSRTATWCNTSDYYLWGVTFTNAGNGGFNATSSGQHRIWRGVNMTPGGGAAIEGFLHLGCTMSTAGSSLTNANGQTRDQSIFAFNVYNNITNTTFLALTTAIPNGAAIVQNVFEYCTASTGNSFAVSHDSMANATTHVIIHSNTVAGFFNNGRSNLFYDDGASARTNKLQSVIGNVFTSINTKGDVFQTSGTRLGNWGFLYGVGCRANFSQYIDANNGGLGTSFAQAYGGVDSLIGTSNATPQMATSNFTNYQATTSGPTAGAGGGTYSGTLATVKGLVTDAVLIADLAGTARSLTADTTGAYAAP